jgi:hypothetical protein
LLRVALCRLSTSDADDGGGDANEMAWWSKERGLGGRTGREHVHVQVHVHGADVPVYTSRRGYSMRM